MSERTTTTAPAKGTMTLPGFQNRLSLLVLIISLVIFWPVMSAEFIPLDDPANVSHNPDFNPPSLAKLGHYWSGPFLNMYAPLTYTAWAGVAQLAWMNSVDERGLQLNPYVFHAVNLLIHLVCAVLVYAILRKSPAPPWAACAGALLFALHPMQVEPVAWVTGFRDLLAAMFSLASLLAYLTHAMQGGRATKTYVLAVAFLLAALLCKPMAVVVPLLAAALDWGLLRRPLQRIAKPVTGLLLVAAPFALLAKYWQSAALVLAPPAWFRPVVAADAIVFYVGKLVLPLRVGLDYGRSPQWLLDQPGYGWAWLAIIPLLIALWLLRRHRPLVAGGAIFVASLLPVLGLLTFDFQHHSTVADRYVYLGMLGPALLLALCMRQRGPAASILCGVVLLLLAARSHVQARAWQNGESIYRAALATNPHSLLANRGLGLLAQSSRQWADAETYFLAALRMHPGDPVASFHLGNLYLGTGRPAEAVTHLRVAAAAREQPWVATNYANALAQSGNLAEARAVLTDAIGKSRDSAELHATLAAVLVAQGERAAAAEHYHTALRINPNFTHARQELAMLQRAAKTAPATTRTKRD